MPVWRKADDLSVDEPKGADLSRLTSLVVCPTVVRSPKRFEGAAL